MIAGPATGQLNGASREAVQALYPEKRNEAYGVNLPMTDEAIAGKYNNFYEFTTIKKKVHELAAGFETHPWSISMN